MKIYIEIAIIDNLIINFILLYLTGKIFKVFRGKLYVFFASLLGTVFALLFPLIHAGNLILIFLKTLLGCVMVYIAFAPKTFKRLSFEFFVFFTLTFLLGGIIYAVFGMFKIDIYNFVLFSTSSVFPISLFVLAVFGFATLTRKFVSLLFSLAKSGGKSLE